MLKAEPKRVLVVHSFSSGAPPFTTASTAFETALKQEMGGEVDLDEVSLDVARYARLDMEEALVQLMRKRQEKWQPDLVVPIGSPAGIFIARFRDRLFAATTPVIYTGMDQRRLPPGTLQQNATFIGTSYDLPGAVENILQIAPTTKNIVVVIGATPLEQFWVEVLRREYQPFENRVKFTWFNDLTFNQMLQRSSDLPPNSFMLLILLMGDSAGVTHNSDEALRRIHEVANAPVNGLFESQLGLGIVGGKLYSDAGEGREAARLAALILRGEPASSFPPQIVPPGQPVYDARELRRWNISEKRLPAGSTVLFREPSTWNRYWTAITGAILFCLLQAALIVSLLVNRARRRQGEEEANMVATISSRFVNLPAGEVDREIGIAQQRIFEILDFDISGLWKWSEDGSHLFRLTHYSRGSGGPHFPEKMSAREYLPWYQEQVLAGRTVAISSVTELPPEAARDRETFRQFGLKSNLTIPLAVGGELPLGALGFSTTRTERGWPDALVKRLQLVAQIFANALARQRADLILRESEARFRTVANTAPVMIWMSGLGNEGVFFNKWWLEFTGRTVDQELGGGWLEGIHAEDMAHALEVCGDAFSRREPFTAEYRLRRRDGEYRWMLDTGIPRFESDGTFLGYIGSCTDIGERKQAEIDHQLQAMELARVGRLALMGELAASLAHEVNNPLCAMVTNAGAAQRMLTHGQLGEEELQELLGDIVSDGHRARDVIHGIHNMVRKGESTHAPVSMNDVINDLLRIVRADAIARHVTLIAEVDPKAGVVLGDRVQLLQVLLNLTMNAFEALSGLPDNARRVVLQAERAEDGKVCASVRDSGHGFREEIGSQLFQPFFSTKVEGTGMGLAIARTIIEGHGGSLTGQNCPDGGALFTICLPEATDGDSPPEILVDSRKDDRCPAIV